MVGLIGRRVVDTGSLTWDSGDPKRKREASSDNRAGTSWVGRIWQKYSRSPWFQSWDLLRLLLALVFGVIGGRARLSVLRTVTVKYPPPMVHRTS